MNDYALRYIKDDEQTMLTLGVQLGAITIEDGTVSATGGGCWDYIGEIHRPTGETTTFDEMEFPVMAPILNPEGKPYLHVNLRTPISLGETARQMAENNPDIASGLARLGDFFLLDENGDARLPNQPHRVFA